MVYQGAQLQVQGQSVDGVWLGPLDKAGKGNLKE